MISLQMITAVPVFQTSGDSVNDRSFFVRLDRTIATQHPDDCFVLVTATEELAVLACCSWIEDRLARRPVASPSRQQSYKHSQLFRLINDVVEMTEIGFVWFCEISIDEW